MNGIQESLVMGLIVLVVCGAAIFWLYSQVSYLNKKVGMLESVLVDLKMAVDSAFQEEDDAALPILGGGGQLHGAPVTFSPPAPLAAAEVEEIPEEKFYSSVLEQAHEGGSSSDEIDAAAGSTEGEEGLERVLAGMASTEAGAETLAQSSPISSQPDYDTMTKADLTALAEKRGLRVKKSNSRNEIIGLLRRTEASASSESSVGDVPGGAASGALFPTGSTLDGDFPVDLGQSGASLEEAIVPEASA